MMLFNDEFDEYSRNRTKYPGAHILVVDDEKSIRTTLIKILDRMGYQTFEANSGKQALERLVEYDIDLIILDLNMPGMSGSEVSGLIQKIAPTTIVIILTAHASLESAITTLKHGAYDYLLKPSTVQEVIQRIESGLSERISRMESKDPVDMIEKALENLKNQKREQPETESEEWLLSAPQIKVDNRKRIVTIRGELVELTSTEFDLLAFFMKNQNQVLSCSDIVKGMRGLQMSEYEAQKMLRSHIHRLRTKIELNSKEPEILRTVHGRGYILATGIT